MCLARPHGSYRATIPASLPAMLISLTPSPTLLQEGISAASLVHGSGCFQRAATAVWQINGRLPLPLSACHYYKTQNYALKGSESSFARRNTLLLLWATYSFSCT